MREVGLTESCLRLISLCFFCTSLRLLRTDFGGGISETAKTCILEKPLNVVEGHAHLLSVVLLPDEGLPTRAMRGSRGMARKERQKEIGVSQKGECCKKCRDQSRSNS